MSDKKIYKYSSDMAYGNIINIMSDDAEYIEYQKILLIIIQIH